jgi:hypothetical protein
MYSCFDSEKINYFIKSPAVLQLLGGDIFLTGKSRGYKTLSNWLKLRGNQIFLNFSHFKL